MKIGIAVIGVAVALAGCATTAGPPTPLRSTWVTERKVDPFTDAMSCWVYPRAITVNRLMSPYALQFYPYVEKRDDQIRVGMFSGGAIQAPAGRIQFRIDGNDAWTIETSETPVDSEAVSSAALAGQMKSAVGDKITPEMAETLERSAGSSAQMVNQAMSPYTATTGERAKAIVGQMRTGTSIIYRQIGANAAASSTGTIALGSDFNAALAACGVQ